MLHVIATVELQPGAREKFLEEFRRLVPDVHVEEGCIDYGPTVDFSTNIAAQIPPRPDVVTVVERWESLAHLEAHLIAPHMVAYRQRVKEFVKSVKLQILEAA
jgi:quinol monooxygenase YgiN